MRRLGPLIALVALAGCGSQKSPSADASSCADSCAPPRLTVLDRVAGQPGGPGWVDGVGPAVHFSDPWTFASDGSRLFLADGSTIRDIDPATATVGTLAGSFGVVGGDDGVGRAATFYEPSGMIVSGGALYLTDTENHTIRKVDLTTAEVTTIAGAYGVNGADDGIGVAARLREPEGLALEDGAILYIADTDNNSIRRMDLGTGAVTTIAGTAGAVGNVDGVAGAARFNKPKAIVLDGAGDLYAVDSGNASLRKVVLADQTVSTVTTFATAPTGMTRDGADLLLSLDRRVVRLNLTTLDVSTVAGATTESGFVDGTGTDARFSERPAGLLNDGQGGLYVADEGNYAVRRITLATGEVTTFAGARSTGSADGTGAEARFWGPLGIAIDGVETAYVADTNNDTIREVNLASGEVTTVAGAVGQAGAADGAPDTARFDQPSGLALDRAARVLYVADAGNGSIRKLDLASRSVTTVASTSAESTAPFAFNHPVGLALDGGNLFITDSGSHTLISLDTTAVRVTVLAGATSQPGAADGTGGTARFYSPSGIVADGRGHLFVADVMNHAIRRVVIATGAVTTLAGAAGVQGHDDGTGAAARFAYPSQLAMDETFGLFVADTNNNTVRYVDIDTAAVTTPIGAPALSGVLLGQLPAQLTAPSALALTSDGHLAVFSENALLLAH